MDLDFGLIGVPYADADGAILPVPYEGTVSYGRGTSMGPAAIIDASQNVETYDFPTDRDYEELAIATLPPPDFADTAPDEAMKVVERKVSSILGDGKFPMMLGGEHSITGPAVRACAAHFGGDGSVGVVQIDAHADLRESYGGTAHSHAAVMSRVRETAPAIQLGIRSCSKEEGERIAKEKLHVYGPADALREGILARALESLPEKIYLTVDVDGLDPSIMPSTGTPEPGGFSWEEVIRIVDEVAVSKELVAADVVELAPVKGLHAPDFLVARLVFHILSRVFLKG